MPALQTPDPFTCPFKVSPSNSSEYLVHYNPMATLINPLGEDTISRLFARGVPSEFGYTTLWVLLCWCAPPAILCMRQHTSLCSAHLHCAACGMRNNIRAELSSEHEYFDAVLTSVLM
jgi:hypothetical protein